ncbi:MAG: hypothetical protein RJA70_4073 [Pseudomonadota bacterium]|jgi:hypothetical protein
MTRGVGKFGLLLAVGCGWGGLACSGDEAAEETSKTGKGTLHFKNVSCEGDGPTCDIVGGASVPREGGGAQEHSGLAKSRVATMVAELSDFQSRSRHRVRPLWALTWESRLSLN